MRLLPRILLNTLTAASLLVGAAMIVLWVRSHWVADAYHARRYNAPMRLPRNLALALSHWIATYATLAAFHLAIHPLKPHRGLLGAAFDYGVIAPLLGTWILLFSSLAELFSAPREPIIIWGTYLPVFLGTYYLLGRKRLTPIGKCPHCGYDLRASPTRCPECGAVREEEPLEHLLLK